MLWQEERMRTLTITLFLPTIFFNLQVSATEPLSPWDEILSQTCSAVANKLWCKAKESLSQYQHWKVAKLKGTAGAGVRLADPCQETVKEGDITRYVNAEACFSGKVFKAIFETNQMAIKNSGLDLFDRLNSDPFTGWTSHGYKLYHQGLNNIPDTQILSSFQQLGFLVEQSVQLNTQIRILQVATLDQNKLNNIYAVLSLFLSVFMLVSYLAATTAFVVSHYRARKRAQRIHKEKQRDKKAYDRAKRDLAKESFELLE